MTTDEKDRCLSIGKAIENTNLESLAAEVYPEQELQSVMIEAFSLSELITLLKRAIKQLRAELKTDNWKILPNNLTDTSQRVITLTGQIALIYTALDNKSTFDEWHPSLLFIIRYEMHHGFWERSKTRVHNPNDLNLAKAQTDIGLLIHSLNDGLDETRRIQARLESDIRAFNEFTTQKEQQFATLDETLKLVSHALSGVRDSEKEAATSNGKITTLLDQTEKTLDSSRKKINQDRKAFDALQIEITTTRQQIDEEFALLKGHRETFDALVVLAKGDRDHILEQEERIMELIGFAADGTLGGVFNNRKKELQWPVYLWIGLSIISVILALCWVIYVFRATPSQDHNSVNWLILLANVVRTSPAFVLVYFCLSQYTKERNIQEEYAFKAAVSMTVTAYADMIGNGEVNERVKMLIDTIQRIYVPPVLGKPIEPISFKSEHIAQAAKSMADTAQNLKSTVTETVKSVKPS